MSLVGGPSPFSPGGVYGVVDRASERVDDLIAGGDLGTKVPARVARGYETAVQTGLINSQEVTELNIWARPDGFDSAEAFLIGQNALLRLTDEGKTQWRDLGVVASQRDVYHL